MGRPKALTEEQIEDAKKKHVGGESISSIAKRLGVARATVRDVVVARAAEIKEVANQIIATEERFNALSLSGRLEAIELADELRAISRNLAGSARHSSMTSFRLSAIAGKQVDKINVDDPMESQEVLQCISALTKMSNDAASLPLSLLNLNKASGKDVLKDDDGDGEKDRVLVYLPDNGR
jgi:Helix-turn-helix domain of resolvase.